jgi:hypothetical protein
MKTKITPSVEKIIASTLAIEEQSAQAAAFCEKASK